MGGLDLVNDPLLVRSGEGVVVDRAELTRPGIEQLHHLGAGSLEHGLRPRSLSHRQNTGDRQRLATINQADL